MGDPQFLRDIRIAVSMEGIVRLHRLLERPFEDTAIETYNLWKEGDGNQRLELVKRDWLDCFREIMRNPEFKKHFDLIFRSMFDAYRKNWG